MTTENHINSQVCIGLLLAQLLAVFKQVSQQMPNTNCLGTEGGNVQ